MRCFSATRHRSRAEWTQSDVDPETGEETYYTSLLARSRQGLVLVPNITIDVGGAFVRFDVEAYFGGHGRPRYVAANRTDIRQIKDLVEDLIAARTSSI